MTKAELNAVVAAAVAEALAVQNANSASATERTVVLRHPEDPASRKQRGKIAQLSGVYPNDTAGYPEFTKQDASDAITALLAGESFEFNGHTLNPS